MIRISDARMSGTAYGTVILHTSPEAAVKGPLAAVQNGDLIEVDVNNGKLHLEVSDEIIAERLKSYTSWSSKISIEDGICMLVNHLSKDYL